MNVNKSDKNSALIAFEKLLNIMDELREKCPWDREQTLESIRPLTIEETYELSEGILDNDLELIKKELGDILLHIVFYAKIGSEKKAFDITDVINGLCDKLIYRHPHVFGEVKVKDTNEVLENWEQLKTKEKDGNKTILSGVPKVLPALIKANRIQEKVKAVGFDWEVRSQIWEKVEEEMNELKAEISAHNQDKMEAEFGDLFFSLVNAARLYNIEPETALERTNRKFMKRFGYLEEKTIKQGRSLKDMSLDEMNVIWEEAKMRDER
jgi:MazG family protein